MERIAQALSVALGQRDTSTFMHSERVITLAVELGTHLGLGSDELILLTHGARFHDIGKIGIPDNILNKPAAFEKSDRDCMKAHPLIGERIIRALDTEHSHEVARVVRHHHENFDGSGYPDGLAGNDIPLHSRIIALTDNYDAMAVARPYHKARSHREVMDILHSECGIKHDPDLLRVFCTIIEKSPAKADD